MIKPKILIIHPNARLNRSLVTHFRRMDRYEVFSSLSHDSSLTMIRSATQKQRFDIVITHFGGLAIDFKQFVFLTKKASPSTRIMLFCESRNLDGLRFDDAVFQDGPESIEVLERRVGLLVYSHSRV